MAINRNLFGAASIGSRFTDAMTADSKASGDASTFGGGISRENFGFGGIGAIGGGILGNAGLPTTQPAPQPDGSATIPITTMPTAQPVFTLPTTFPTFPTFPTIPTFPTPIPFPFPTPLPQPTPQSRTATQLARGAIDQFNGAQPPVVREAINAANTTLRGQNLANDALMDYLERRVRVGEVLNQLARDWSETTRTDFAGAFSMAADRLDTMDCIVSLAILNDRELEAELRFENTPQTTPGDLMQNRRVVWQSHPAGTVLSPPYVILIAVEYQDVAQADDVVRSITGQLDTVDGFKMPQAAIGRLPR